jgi:tRNA(Leu) C34 or U34 (ribose-2'-O)-methylase TrmL
MRGFSAVGLEQPKTPQNVGSALRACNCYGASMLAVSGKRFKKASTDTFKTWRHMPVFEVDDLKLIIPYDCVPVAVDLIPGAQKLNNYKHPERAFYIFGPEDGTVSNKIISWCRDVVYVPTNRCMNLAATVNVVLYDRMVKSHGM